MAIEALKVNTKNSDFIWIRILSEKLYQESRRQWELDYSEKRLETFQQLRVSINKRVQALDASSSVTTTRKVNQSTNYHKFGRNQKIESKISQNYETTSETCHFCSENHKFFACKKFASLNVKDRKNLVYSSKLYFICFCPGPLTKDCQSKHTCKRCLGKRTSLPHTDSAQIGEVSGSVIANLALTFSASGIIPTALVPIEDDSSNTTICRALIDNGYQLSLISESAVQRMHLKLQKR